MELKKLLALGLALGLSVGSVGCTNKKGETTTDNNTNTTQNSTTTQDNGYLNTEYANTYSGLYTNNISPLNNYAMYSSVDEVNNAYKTKEYPGNEKYLSEVKAAYQDSKEKLQAFVNGLKNDAKTDDAKLKEANQELIDEGEDLIEEIDEKISRLDTIPKDAYNKSQDEFIKLVDDTTKVENDVRSEFDKMIKYMNNMLGIDTTSNNGKNK